MCEDKNSVNAKLPSYEIISENLCVLVWHTMKQQEMVYKVHQ